MMFVFGTLAERGEGEIITGEPLTEGDILLDNGNTFT
jgi:hypothetical protein